MDFIRTVLHWANVAWSAILGIPGDIGTAFDHVWRFIGSLTSLLAHLYGRIARDVLQSYLQVIADVIDALDQQSRALDRVKAWIYRYDIVPLRSFLLVVIARLAAAVNRQLALLKALELRLYILSLTFTLKQVAAERAARIADVRAARAYALHLTIALRKSLELEAGDAYNAHTKDRVSVITRLLDEIVSRNPVVRGFVSEFITLLLDFIDVENPELRFLLKLLLPKIVNGLGIDKPLGDMLTALFGSVAGTPKAHSIGDAVGDLAARVSALENLWAQFMVHGGPEIEQAGDEWKSITSLSTNVALLGFFGLAVTEPGAWATAISDTIGAAVNDSAAAVAHLIRNA